MASTSASTPAPTVPSVQQESTLEEDYFAELLLDGSDAEYDLDLAPKKKSREERMEEAVTSSKKEYRYDHGRTDLWVGWLVRACGSQQDDGVDFGLGKHTGCQ
jgi:hypothetical protein